MSQFMPRSRLWLVASVLLFATPQIALAKKAACTALKTKGDCRKKSDCAWKAGSCGKVSKALAKAKTAPSPNPSAGAGAPKAAPSKAPVNEEPAADSAAGDEDF